MSIEREHLEAALAEAEAVVQESERMHARSAAVESRIVDAPIAVKRPVAG